jgi:serine phosphatase RsbU (regulator of sigma subunit)
MGTLVTLKGPFPGRRFPLDQPTTVLGRQASANICLESQAVSRQHARIHLQDGRYLVEDLHSSNGTYLNGKRLRERVAFKEGDTLQIGPYHFTLRVDATLAPEEDEVIIREQIKADTSHHTLFAQDAAQKLKVVLEISQHLARTLDMDALLGKLLDHLLGLFAQADRGMVVLCEGDQLVVRAQRNRRGDSPRRSTYSRTVVKKALETGAGILSDDARSDARFQASATLTYLSMRSLMCVPMIGQEGKHLGALQLDCYQPGRSFQVEDLQLLTAVGLQVAVVLENAALHAELLREERLRQELALAREIQQGYLPAEFPNPAEAGFELFATVHSAQEVSGDFYDFFSLPDKRLGFFVGDVAGKGIPAALFMVAVRSLSRHLALTSNSPAETLARLNTALAADNSTCMFVTLAHGIYEPATGVGVYALGGHPAPLLRRANGGVEELLRLGGQIIGYEGGERAWTDTPFRLEPGETLVLYTDGFTEARRPKQDAMFGLERLQQALGGDNTSLGLEACVDAAFAAVERFTGSADFSDDLTLFLLRRFCQN